MIASLIVTSLIQLFGIVAISICGTYLLLFLAENFSKILGCVAFNVGYGILILFSNIVGTLATLSFENNSRIEFYNLKEVALHWHFLVKDVTALHEFFEQPVESDLVKIRIENYAEFLNLIETTYQPIAMAETKKFADYMAANFGKDYKTLYQFMRMHFDYETERVTECAFECVKLPNRIWEDGKGDCEDFGLFVSGVLSNWGINHRLNISVFDNKAHFFTTTEGGTIIDPCCHKFNKRINGEKPFWQTAVVILADNGSEVAYVK